MRGKSKADQAALANAKRIDELTVKPNEHYNHGYSFPDICTEPRSCAGELKAFALKKDNARRQEAGGPREVGSSGASVEK